MLTSTGLTHARTAQARIGDNLRAADGAICPAAPEHFVDNAAGLANVKAAWHAAHPRGFPEECILPDRNDFAWCERLPFCENKGVTQDEVVALTFLSLVGLVAAVYFIDV
eukprot:5489050-Prymnesium_polylepis.1